MKKTLGITIALTAIGVAVKASKKKNEFSVTVTNRQDELLADISDGDVIFHDDVKVYVNSQLIN